MKSLICLATTFLAVSAASADATADATTVSSSLDVAWYEWLLILGLLCLSGLFSGLNLGLMSLDTVGLDIVIRGNDGVDSEYAKALMPLRLKGNFLLCTLLLGNTLVNALLAIFLADIAGGLTGSLITTFAIVIFGEIMPQSICSRHGLKVGYMTRHIVMFFMFATCIISYPIAALLDAVLGKEIGSVYSRQQLKTLIEVHSADKHGNLISDEIALLTGALGFTKRVVRDIMSPIKDVFMLDVNDRLDDRCLAKIVQEGYSRVPVLENDNIVTILLIKNLIVLDPNEATPVRQLLGQGCCLDPYYVDPSDTLDHILNEFQKGRTHMAIVQDITNRDRPGGSKRVENIGLLTLEDVIEALIQEEIEDETDHIGGKGFVEDLDRYRDLNTANKRHVHLHEKEVETVSDWLLTNHPDIFDSDTFSPRRCKYFIRLCAPITLYPAETGQPAHWLWKKGDTIDSCYLVLDSGPLHVHATEHNFVSHITPWNLIGISILDPSVENYVPDFSVEVAHPVRLLKIEKKNYQQFIEASQINTNPEKNMHHRVQFQDKRKSPLLLNENNSSESNAVDADALNLGEEGEPGSVAIEMSSMTSSPVPIHAKQKSRITRAKSATAGRKVALSALQLIGNPQKAAVLDQAVKKVGEQG